MVERIRELLDARQLSPTQFADTIGIGRPVVSHILSGRNKPSLEVIQKVIAAFPDLALPWLLNGEGPMLTGSAPTTAAPVTEEKLVDTQNKPVAARTRRPSSSTTKKAAVSSPESSKPAPVVQAAVPSEPIPAEVEHKAVSASPVPPYTAPTSAASPTAPAVGPPRHTLPNPEKAIRRIVIFYHDGTFVDYQPEN